jgi:uncharacterized protein (DUF433 family)
LPKSDRSHEGFPAGAERACSVREEAVEDLLDRITFKKDILCGNPLIRDLRISVGMVLDILIRSATGQGISEDYPELEADDLRAAAQYQSADETG